VTVWITIALIGLGTFLLRLSFLAVEKPNYPPAVERALRYVPVAVLAALVAPAILLPPGEPMLLENPRLLPALVAGLVAWRTQQLGLTIGVGMLALWALD
jgi:branched chain amino acid efflux pump